MKPLPTVEELRAALDYDPDTGTLAWRVRDDVPPKWNGRYAGRVVNCAHNEGYIVVTLHKRRHLAHRVAWAMRHGRWPEGQIDHINGQRDDNRAANLREATHAENGRNAKRPAHNTSGYKGVSWHKLHRTWRATIKVDQRAVHLGYFATREEAHAAYIAAAQRHHGEFARAA